MALKDYYEVLEIPTGSPEAVIKKAYRKLAMRYHPDKNMGNPYAVHQFREIQEAYKVLSNPVTRNEYHHKKWRYPDMGNNLQSNHQVTTDLLELEARKIAQYVQNLDVFRMNFDALYNQLDQLLHERHLAIIHEEPDVKVKQRLIENLIQCCQPIPFPYLFDIPDKLLLLAGANNQLINCIHQMVLKKRKQYLWDKYKALVMISIALTICVLIYVIA